MVDIVAWSGGLDSTLVLERLCSSGKSIWAFSIVWDLIDKLKTKQEKIARSNYLMYAKERGYDIEHREIVVTADMGVDGLGLLQCLGLHSFLVPYLSVESTLYFGYHKGDDFWMYAQFVLFFIDYAARIGERKVILEYPLRDMRKYRIMKEFKERRIPLSCIWTCEKPVLRNRKIIKCGKCDPCITMELANYESDLRK